MNQHTRQRIVGTVVLLLVAAVLLPLVLDGDGVTRQPLDPRIPEPPATPAVPEPATQRPDIAADADGSDVTDDLSAQSASGADQSSTRDSGGQQDDRAAESGTDADTQQPTLDDEGLPRGWSVRLGAFSNAENVENLLARLREADYAAYTRDIEAGGQQLTAVFVGPKVDRDDADGLQQELMERFDLEGRVERYRIEDFQGAD